MQKVIDPRNGFRTNGERKMRLINQANLIMLRLGSKGIKVKALLRYLGIKGDGLTITTKQWPGVIGQLKAFEKRNDL